jgi:hypothetical protein
MFKKHTALLVILLVSTASGCASIIDGRTQTVTFNSEPQGAQIIINGMPMGVTPASIGLKRSDYDNANLLFRREGFQDQTVTMRTKLNGWFWGNVISGGLLGSATDAISGAMWEYSPNNHFVTLNPIKSSAAEMARLDYEKKVRQFVLFSYEQLASDLAKGGGESLVSLYSLLNVNEEQSNDILDRLRTLALSSENPPTFAEVVLKQFLKIPL